MCPSGPLVLGKRGERDDFRKRDWLFPAYGALEPNDIARRDRRAADRARARRRGDQGAASAG